MELEQAIGSERFVRWRVTAEPLVALAARPIALAALERGQPIVAMVKQLHRSPGDLGPCLARISQILQNQQVRVTAARSLFETSVRLAEHSFQSGLQAGQKRR